jgi:hypothetical protein
MKFNIFDLENHLFFFRYVKDALSDNDANVDKVPEKKNESKFNVTVKRSDRWNDQPKAQFIDQ